MPTKHRARSARPQLRLLAGSCVIALVAGGSALLAPQMASAAEKFSTAAIYGTVSGSSSVVSIDRATGATATVLTEPTGATALNQLGFTNDGDKLLMTNDKSIFEYTASSGTWEVTPRSGTAAAVATQMGGVDPRTDKFWFGGFSASTADEATFTFTSYDPATNTIAGTSTTVKTLSAPGTNGDLAFDRLGNMYFISSSNVSNGGTGTAQVFRVDAAALDGGTTKATPVGPSIAPPSALTSLAFADDGYLYISGTGANSFLKVNPVTGAILERRSPRSALTDMGTRQYPSTGQASTTLSEGRHDTDDQFTVAVGGGDIPKPATASTIDTGTSATAGPVILLPGQSYTATQTPANDKTNPADYATAYQCTDLGTGAVVSEGTGSTAAFTVPSANGSNVKCAFTNPLAGPTAQDDTSRGNAEGRPVTVDVLANDSGDLDATTVRLLATGVTGAQLSSDGRTLVVPGEGTWTVDPTTGRVTFTPAAGTAGDPTTLTPTPVGYTVDDVRGKRGSAAITVAFAGTAVADAATTSQGSAVEIDVLGNDRGRIDRTSVTFPASGQPAGAVVSDDGRTMTVPGQGTWTASATTGTITFTPDPAFRGDAAPVTYRALDADGTASTAPVSVSVTALAPRATDDIATTGQNAPVTIDVTANDAPGVTGGTPVDPTTVVFPAAGQPVGVTVSDDGRTATVADQGTYRADPLTGVVTFTPAPGYAGDVAIVTYQVSDTSGLTDTATIEVTVNTVAPTANPDRPTTTQGRPVVTDVLDNDDAGNEQTPIDPTSVSFTTPGQPADATVSKDGRTLTVPDQGVYEIDPGTGEISFTPEPAFRGEATPVSYWVADSDGESSVTTVTVTVTPVGPAPADDTDATSQNTPVLIDVTSNDAPGVEGGTPLDPTTVVFPTAGQPSGATVSTDGRTLTVPGQGTWTADPATGGVTYTPAQGATGTTSPVVYQVADTGGAQGTGSITVTVAPVTPTATDDTAETRQGTPVTVDVVDNDRGGNARTAVEPTSVVFPSAGQPTGAVVSTDGRTLTVADQGSYTIDPATGAITFTPVAGLRGTASPVVYGVSDVDRTATTATLTVTVRAVGPRAQDDTASTPQNTPVTIDLPQNDAPGVAGGTMVDPSTVVFTSAGQPKDAVVSDGGRKLTVPSQGVWTVDRTSGVVTFTPADGFAGTTTPVTYRIADAGGATSTAVATVTVTPVAPRAVDDQASTPQNTPVTIDLLANDAAGVRGGAAVDPTSVLFTTTGQPAGALLADGGKTLTLPGVGVLRIDPAKGSVVFTPAKAFVGSTAPVTYQVTDARGLTATATVVVTVTSVVPTAAPDSAQTPARTPVTIDPVANDAPGNAGTPLAPTSVRLLDGAGSPVTVVAIAGTGTFTVDTTTGRITFAPEAGYTGTVTVPYVVGDVDGGTARSTVTVTVGTPPTAVDDRSSTTPGTPVTVTVTGNDSSGSTALDPRSVQLVDPATGELVSSVTVPGTGTFTVGTDGTITFTPEATFAGTATVAYSVADEDGSRSIAELAVTVPAAPVPATPGIAVTPAAEGGGVVVTAPGGGSLAFTGTELAVPASMAVLLLVAGGSLLVVRRRKPARRH
ncbi:tandem-95 repeat protein [Frigoribacterium sp. ACAM 257]|uniref:beta strand repeat-containing protein n=1 Tax=Frigoribacterium sp. ACAM 257 TaxID=2508998 RepID=UPI0011B9DED0|nr:tandem-95 repeat protein [Frigoribacterium sp. ACAM 257]TWX39973.1 tandem-95 repeat protein [Frigoribacterium sp. ACAM 257]